MDQNLPVTRDRSELVSRDFGQLTRDQMELIKQTIAKDATDDELAMFAQVCNTTGLNPFAKEIYFVKYKMRDGTSSVAMPVGIDGLRRKAAESGDYMGQVGPFWCGDDGLWKEVWLSKGPPTACKVGVLRRDNPEPTWAVVKWSEFSKAAAGKRGQFWRDMPVHMMAITAERHALKKATPRLVEKLEIAGAQVMRADYLIAKAEQRGRQQALPHRVPPTDLHEDLYGQSAAGQLEADQTAPGVLDDEGQSEEQKPAKWTEDDVAKLKQTIEERNLSSKEWRGLLGLPEETIVGDLVALGSVDHVIALLTKALDLATIPGMNSSQPILF